MKPTRRQVLATLGTTGVVAATTSAHAQLGKDQVAADFRVNRGRIRQSVMGWCFRPMSAIELAGHGRDIGLVAIEGISASDYPAVRELGLEISLVGSHGFQRGPVNRDNHAFCIEKLKDSIDLAVKVNSPSVITFTGMREDGIDFEQGAANCVACWTKKSSVTPKRRRSICASNISTREMTRIP